MNNRVNGGFMSLGCKKEELKSRCIGSHKIPW